MRHLGGVDHENSPPLPHIMQAIYSDDFSYQPLRLRGSIPLRVSSPAIFQGQVAFGHMVPPRLLHNSLPGRGKSLLENEP